MSERPRPLAVVITTGFEEYQQRLVRGAASALNPHGRVVVLSSFDPLRPELPPEVVQMLRRARPYGVLASATFAPEAESALAAVLAESGVPAVRIGVSGPGIASVTSDDESGMRALMEHLIRERGIRRPLLVRGVPHQQDSIRREAVVRQVLGEHGLGLDEGLVVDGEFWHEQAYTRTRELLTRRRDFDALVAANDLSAIGAMRALADAGLRVPEDVLVAGFDNDRTAELTWPGLTSVDPGLEEQGRVAAELLLAALDAGAEPAQRIVPSRLVRRGSTGFSGRDRGEAAVVIAHRGMIEVGERDGLRALSGSVHECTSVADLVGTLAGGHLARLGVSRCFLALYTGAGGEKTPEEGFRARLCLDYRDGAARSLTEETYPMDRLLPAHLESELDSGTLVVLPLTAPHHRLGYVMFEQDGGSGLVADALRVELSRLLERVLVMEELQAHADALERTVAARTAELRRANADLELLALSDPLTGLGNRTALERHLARHLGAGADRDRWAAPGGELALAMLDVDLFKQYNDHFGHLAGDDTLRLVAARLRLALGHADDLACRFGGEEFVIVLTGGLTRAIRTLDTFRRLLADAAVPHPVSSVAPVVTVSVGLALTRTGPSATPHRLLEAADAALYRAKAGGRDQIHVNELNGHEVVSLGPVLPTPRRR